MERVSASFCIDGKQFVHLSHNRGLQPDLVPQSGARPAAPRPTHNSVPAASAIFWRPTSPAPNDWPRKLAYAFSSNAVSLDGDPVC